jgi:hypothetical protein
MLKIFIPIIRNRFDLAQGQTVGGLAFLNLITQESELSSQLFQKSAQHRWSSIPVLAANPSRQKRRTGRRGGQNVDLSASAMRLIGGFTRTANDRVCINAPGW